MNLKSSTNLTEFMKSVQACTQEVYFVTCEGDRLNLKSALSQFLFVSLQGQKGLVAHGTIECQAETDWSLLQGFLEK